MPEMLSANTQAILLLTAPLMLGKSKSPGSVKLLKPSEYQRLARRLVELKKQPSDLLAPSAEEVIRECEDVIELDRIRTLLTRGFLLSQALERWQSRAIWVVSRADARYPRVLKKKLKAKAPAILYGCGKLDLLRSEGLAIVGSRRVSDDLLEYAAGVGALAARAGLPVASGGARGVDRASMDGALAAGGQVVGVLAEELEREAMHRKNRAALRSGQLVLISQYDPCSRFTIGHAMQRNKLIYAFAKHALVVNSDLKKGGTWAGAIEQLEKLHFSTVFVRSTGRKNDALEALRRRGAKAWPNAVTEERFFEQLSDVADRLGPDPTDARPAAICRPEQIALSEAAPENKQPNRVEPAEALFRFVRKVVLEVLDFPRTESEIAEALEVSKGQVRDWLKRLADQGAVERTGRPIRYHRAPVRHLDS